MTLLKYPPYTDHKSRSIKQEALGGREEAAVFDLIWHKVPLRIVARQMGVSYQGVYIRALAYVQKWATEGKLGLDPDFIEYLSHFDETNTEGAADD